MSASYDSKPWYIQKKKNQLNLLHGNVQESSFLQKILKIKTHSIKFVKIFSYAFLSLCCASSFGFCLAKLILSPFDGKSFFIYFILCILFFICAVYFAVAQIGHVADFFMEKKYHISNFLVGLFYLQSKIEKTSPKKGSFVSELVLRQFLQQVRVYAAEKNYNNQKKNDTSDALQQEGFLKRRWNDVQDTLDEFDVYLANNPSDVISKLVAHPTCQHRDVSHIFREIAETAENTWRAKGINIEHAIVIPLKSNMNDKLLKRLLAGPWRACAYFSTRTNGVVFSSKSESNKILARWECEGVTYAQNFFEIVKNQTLSVNERIEQAIELIANDPKNSNILLGLISLIIWHDLAIAAAVDFDIIQGSEGLIVKLTI